MPSLPHCALSLKLLIGGLRTSRTLVGKEVAVGVAGRTLTEWWGLRAPMGVLETASDPLEEVDEALE